MRFFYILFLIFFIGCSNKEYVIWKNNIKNAHIQKINKTIGINLQIPEYMLSGNFVEIKKNKLIYLNKEIPQIPKIFFENYLIINLNNNLKCNIREYPWDFTNEKPFRVYFIKIKDFYKEGNFYVLNYLINNKYFSIKSRYKKDGFRKTFDKMIYNIKKNLKKDCKWKNLYLV